MIELTLEEMKRRNESIKWYYRGYGTYPSYGFDMPSTVWTCVLCGHPDYHHRQSNVCRCCRTTPLYGSIPVRAEVIAHLLQGTVLLTDCNQPVRIIWPESGSNTKYLPASSN